jgi:hypothetical protein
VWRESVEGISEANDAASPLQQSGRLQQPDAS